VYSEDRQTNSVHGLDLNVLFGRLGLGDRHRDGKDSLVVAALMASSSALRGSEETRR
jgi:hypothetical protein